MPSKKHSSNPDLLLPDVMNERVKRVSDFWGFRVGELNRTDRITAIITHRCNLRCVYCNGPHLTLNHGDTERKKTMLKSDMTLAQFAALLTEAQQQAPIKHIHFTGGEPTLNADLPAMIALAGRHKILTSITTNGTADLRLYNELVESGLTEVRVSLDSSNPGNFDEIVGVKDTFDKVIRTLIGLAWLRDGRKKDLFIVINACVGQMNLAQIEKIVRFLIGLNPNDVKLLVIAEDKNFILRARNEETLARLRGELQKYPEDQFILLRTKLENLFNPIATGLVDKHTQQTMKHCFVPMTERTVDSRHYFPCSIYVRYYGEPIGPLTDSFAQQQKQIMEFVRRHDCRQDPICREHCTNCCKVFNVRTNSDLVINENQTFFVTSHASAAEKENLRQRVLALIQQGELSDRPFLIIKPHGQKWRREILARLKNHDLTVESVERLNRWEDCALYLYAWPLDDEELQFTLALDRAFQVFERGPADILRFKQSPAAAELLQIKHDLRETFPTARIPIMIARQKRTIRLNAVHTPNETDILRENAILRSLLQKQVLPTPRLRQASE